MKFLTGLLFENTNRTWLPSDWHEQKIVEADSARDALFRRFGPPRPYDRDEIYEKAAYRRDGTNIARCVIAAPWLDGPKE